MYTYTSLCVYIYILILRAISSFVGNKKRTHIERERSSQKEEMDEEIKRIQKEERDREAHNKFVGVSS